MKPNKNDLKIAKVRDEGKITCTSSMLFHDFQSIHIHYECPACEVCNAATEKALDGYTYYDKEAFMRERAILEELLVKQLFPQLASEEKNDNKTT